MLEKEFKYFVDHQSDLVEKYNNKFIVIKDQAVIGSYDSHADAYNETLKTEKLGTFLIQLLIFLVVRFLLLGYCMCV